MLKEFVESIAQMAVKATKPTVIEALTDRKNVALAMPDGSLCLKPRRIGERRATVETLAELARINGEISSTWENRQVFLCQIGTMMQIETESGIDMVGCPFAKSDAWKLLEKMEEGGTSFDQKSFLRHGRFTLQMTPDQLEPFRKMDFSATHAVVGEVRKTSESLGRSINSTVLLGSPTPDTIELSVPIFRTPGEDSLYRVSVDLEISTADQRIILKPLPGEVDHCMARHLADARERLVKAMGNKACPVYLGTCWS